MLKQVLFSKYYQRKFYRCVISIFLVCMCWTYVYVGWMTGAYPRYVGEIVYEKYISRNDEVYTLENVCIESVHDTKDGHDVTLHAYTDTWEDESDVITLEHLNWKFQRFGQYTIKKRNRNRARNFEGAAILSTVSCSDGFFHFLAHYVRFVWGKARKINAKIQGLEDKC